MKKIKLVVIILLISILAVPCFAQDPAVPQIIEYTGSLTKPNGSPYPGDFYDIYFQICTKIDCSGAEDPIWDESHSIEISAKNKKDIDGGTSYIAAYTVQLGADPENPINFPFDQDYYLRVSEDTLGYESAELFVSVTSALTAENAVKVYDSDIGDYSQVQGVNINNSKKAKKADTVFDSDDGTYKEVQAVNINNAKNAKNADLLDNHDSTYFAVAGHSHSFSEITGEISDNQVPNNITINFATNAGNAGTLDGHDSSYFAPAHSHPYASDNHNHDGSYAPNLSYTYACTVTWLRKDQSYPDEDLRNRDVMILPPGWGCNHCERIFNHPDNNNSAKRVRCYKIERDTWNHQPPIQTWER